ncbi:MAG: hypothetical protein LBG72_01155 [Spirochaetaceae bacterium]|jgi:diaminopimelate epimerase|nr:hypothetical protein [Spirochaetaceae bacterium]
MNTALILANPAGNITAFVLDGARYNVCGRRELAASIMRKGVLKPGWQPVEQVGFVYKPDEPPGGEAPEVRRGLWHLEMAGGEFCGNAARSFGLLAAAIEGINNGLVKISVSGAAKPIDVQVDIGQRLIMPQNSSGNMPPLPLEGKASAACPPPERRAIVRYANTDYALYFFPGIAHLIAPELAPTSDTFFALKTACESLYGEQPAFGVMFTKYSFVTPAVYVREPETFVFESSCGSGSAAFACHLLETKKNIETEIAVQQPGGIIEVAITKQNGLVTSLRIGGMVQLETAGYSRRRPFSAIMCP